MIKKIFRRILLKYNDLRHKHRDKVMWEQRIQDVVQCPDNYFISRHARAGKLEDSFQIMHNGLKIIRGSYYGKNITKMLSINKGVHEPQEERVFAEVLKNIRPNSTMIELGSYWSFYSMWFLQATIKGQTYMFEPDKENLNMGEVNFRSNNFCGDFNNAFIGKKLVLDSTPPTLTIDYIVQNKRINFIDILHCDIQGNELDMLIGAAETIQSDKVGYFFISTHSNEIHESCLNRLQSYDYNIVCEADLTNSYSVDGIIVARSKNYPGIDKMNISQKLSKSRLH